MFCILQSGLVGSLAYYSSLFSGAVGLIDINKVVQLVLLSLTLGIQLLHRGYRFSMDFFYWGFHVSMDLCMHSDILMT